MPQYHCRGVFRAPRFKNVSRWRPYYFRFVNEDAREHIVENNEERASEHDVLEMQRTEKRPESCHSFFLLL